MVNLKREAILKKALYSTFGEFRYKKRNKDIFFNSIYNKEIRAIYLCLGGKEDVYPTKFRSFDIQLKNCIVELDEEQHFNRYRAITLESEIYNKNSNFDVFKYKIFCNKFENYCSLKGNFFETNGSKKQFKEPLIGGTRWIQRAFYDYLRDIYSAIVNIPIIRLSVYEKVGKTQLGMLLNKGNSKPIVELIKDRLNESNI